MPAVLDNLSAFLPQSSLCCFSIFSRRPSRESIFILIWVSSRLMVCSWSVFTAEAHRREVFHLRSSHYHSRFNPKYVNCALRSLNVFIISGYRIISRGSIFPFWGSCGFRGGGWRSLQSDQLQSYPAHVAALLLSNWRLAAQLTPTVKHRRAQVLLDYGKISGPKGNPGIS